MDTLKKRRKKETPHWSELLINRSINFIPPVVRESLDWIERNALRVTGLFRISGSFASVDFLKDEYLKAGDSFGMVDLDSVGCKYSIASLVVHFLKDLEDPILTIRLKDAFLSIRDVQPKELRLECIRLVIGLLPVGCRAILSYLMSFLRRVHELREYNKMSYSNLAIVFAPTFLPSADPTVEDLSLIEASKTIQQIIEAMILDYDAIFMQDALTTLPAEITGDFRRHYQEALRNYSSNAPRNTPHSTPRAVSSPSSGPLEHGTTSQRKLLTQHQRLKNQTAIMNTLVSARDPRDGGQDKNSAADLKKYPLSETAKAIFQGALVRYSLRNLSKKRQSKINLAFRKVLLLQQNLVDNLEELTLRYFPHFIALVQQGQLKLHMEFVSVARDVITTNKAFLFDLLSFWDSWPLIVGFGPLLLRFMNRLQSISKYCTLMFPFLEDVKIARRRLPELDQWLEQASLASKDHLTLEELIVLPVLQLTTYRVPLQHLLNACLDHEEWALQELRVVVSRDSPYLSELLILLRGLVILSRSIEQQEDMDQLAQLESQFDSQISFALQGRQLVRQGNLLVNSKKRYVFLFSDMLLVGRPVDRKGSRAGSCYHALECFPLERVVIEDSTVGSSSQMHKRFVLRILNAKYDILCKTLEEKVHWLTDFEVSVTKHNNKLFNVNLVDLLRRKQRHVRTVGNDLSSSSPTPSSNLSPPPVVVSSSTPPPSPSYSPTTSSSSSPSSSSLSPSLSSSSSSSSASPSPSSSSASQAPAQSLSSSPGFSKGLADKELDEKLNAERDEAVPESIDLLIQEIVYGKETPLHLFRYLAEDYAVESLRNALEVPDKKRKVPFREMIKSSSSHELAYVLRSFFEDLPVALIVFDEALVNKLFPWHDMYYIGNSLEVQTRPGKDGKVLQSRGNYNCLTFRAPKESPARKGLPNRDGRGEKTLKRKKSEVMPKFLSDNHYDESGGDNSSESDEIGRRKTSATIPVVDKSGINKRVTLEKGRILSKGRKRMTHRTPDHNVAELLEREKELYEQEEREKGKKGKKERLKEKGEKQDVVSEIEKKKEKKKKKEGLEKEGGKEEEKEEENGNGDVKEKGAVNSGHSPKVPPLDEEMKKIRRRETRLSLMSFDEEDERGTLWRHVQNVKPSIPAFQKMIVSMSIPEARLLLRLCRALSHICTNSSAITFHHVSVYFGISVCRRAPNDCISLYSLTDVYSIVAIMYTLTSQFEKIFTKKLIRKILVPILPETLSPPSSSSDGDVLNQSLSRPNQTSMTLRFPRNRTVLGKLGRAWTSRSFNDPHAR